MKIELVLTITVLAMAGFAYCKVFRIALTAHLVKPDGQLDDPLIDQIQHELHDRFGIAHVTVQLECGTCDRSCLQEPNNVV